MGKAGGSNASLRLKAEKLKTDLAIAQQTISEQKMTIAFERVSRISAQRGLVPYVRSLQFFNEWLKQRPKIEKAVGPILKELGLYEVSVAYDPDADPDVIEEIKTGILPPKPLLRGEILYNEAVR